MAKQSKKQADNCIVTNNKARYDLSILETFEAGLMLEGWEVKSLRERRAQLKESYVVLKEGEAWLIGAHFSPTSHASTHINPDPVRTRKLLLHEKELVKLFRAKERDGCTVVALDLHWKRQYAKATIAIGRGKKKHDKRETSKERDWNRQKQRLLKKS